jgi:isoleucyl-tRNA synthetase
MLGKKYGRLFPKLQAAVADMKADSLVQKFQRGQSVRVNVDDQVVTLQPNEVEVCTQPREGYVLAEEEGVTVGIETVITEELRREGLARDLVRRIQNQRKEAGFNIADWIEVYYQAGSKFTEVFAAHENYISSETLATSIKKAEPPKGAYAADYDIDGESIRLGLVRTEKTET